MKKILIVSICTLFFLTTITVAVNANILLINSNENTPPNPPVISGPSSGKIERNCNFDVTVSDPDEEDHLIVIEINFSDGTIACGGCDGRGPWHSGDVVDFNHSWAKEGTFEITGRVKDEYNAWSEWSDPIAIIMPYLFKPMPQFFEWLLQRFPHAFPLLQKLLE